MLRALVFWSNPANVQPRPIPVAGGLEDFPEDLCQCGHPAFDGHDMRDANVPCLTCDCGRPDWHPCSVCGPDASHEDRNCATQLFADEPAHQFLCPCVRCTNRRINNFASAKDLTFPF